MQVAVSVFAGHHDKARTEDREESREPMPPRLARCDIAVEDGPESALDVADMRGVEHGGLNRLGDFHVHRHGSSPFAVAGSRTNHPTVSRRGSARERRRLVGFDSRDGNPHDATEARRRGD
jgi:hypothetical protein